MDVQVNFVCIQSYLRNVWRGYVFSVITFCWYNFFCTLLHTDESEREIVREKRANVSTGTGILSRDDKKWRMKEAGKESSAMNFLFRISHLRPISRVSSGQHGGSGVAAKVTMNICKTCLSSHSDRPKH